MHENNHCCNAVGYYESLSAAVADINSGVVRVSGANGGKVMVTHAYEGRPTVRLLEDITERVAITVNKDMDLDLNGKTISFTEEGCLSFGAGTDCTICGAVEGSAIQRTLAENATSWHLLETAGASLKLKGGSYQISGYHPKNFLCFRATETCGLLELTDCQVAAVNGENETAAGVVAVQSKAVQTLVRNTTVLAEGGIFARIISGEGSFVVDKSLLRANAGSGQARGIHNKWGTVTIVGTEIDVNSVLAPSHAVYNSRGMVTIDGSTVRANSEEHRSWTIEVVDATLHIAESHVYATAGRVEGCGVHCAYSAATITNTTFTSASEADCAHAVFSAGGKMNIEDCTLNADSNSGNSFALCGSDDGVITVEGSAIHASAQIGGATGVDVAAGTIIVEGCVIDAVTYSEGLSNAYGIRVECESALEVRDTRILTDAKNNSADEGLLSIGILNWGTATVKNVTLNGTYCGVQNCEGAKLYVSGGTYTGHSLGGFYLAHGSEGEAFINDATLRGGNYAGAFEYSALAERKYSALHIGGDSNVTVYLDGCTIDGTDSGASIVLSGTGDVQGNTLNVSNCILVAPGKLIRVDSNDLRINIGMGGNITAASLASTDNSIDYVEAGRAAFTGDFYRKHPANHIFDGRDFTALVALVEAKLTA